MDLRSVARRLGVNERHVRRLVAERRIPFIKWGHLLRFDPTDIEQWLNDSRHIQMDVSEFEQPPTSGRRPSHMRPGSSTGHQVRGA